ncbi:hypothetical protein GCM10023088_78470 [Actinomadura verrucosospora]|uniref:hypothetical protein n=1 Tax=Actinomadura verrucosospora TaxID=46165 RepID=UPI0031E59269
MTLATITLLAALAALLLYLAPLHMLGAGAALATLLRPDLTMTAGHLLAVLAITAAAAVAWRELRDTGWRLLMIRS